MDEVRRLTNFSTGRLGCDLARHLVGLGHKVTLLIGAQASWPERPNCEVLSFSTTSDLQEQLEAFAAQAPPVDAVFHAAAVSDFQFGRIWSKSADGSLVPVSSGKISTRQGTLLAELLPTAKLIVRLRDWFPRAKLVGWKFEVEGDGQSTILAARQQLADCRTDACVVNGPAYGPGFGVVTPSESCHYESAAALYRGLERLLSDPGPEIGNKL